MNRPSRLIAETVSVDNLDFPDFYFELQKGDTLTGFEIIAGLPLDEQTDSDMIYLYWQQAVGRIPLDGRTESAGL